MPVERRAQPGHAMRAEIIGYCVGMGQHAGPQGLALDLRSEPGTGRKDQLAPILAWA
jgi:hypothetical protein